MSRRFHLSNDPKLQVRFPDKMLGNGNFKPRGFWYDVDLDWLRWLEGEEYFNDSRWMRPYLYEVFIDESAYLKIRDVTELDVFHEQYSKPLLPGMVVMKEINWDLVAEQYSGVEIAPYLWERRLYTGFTWYYAWDCASGVVWRPDALKDIRLLTRTKRKTIKFYKNQKGSSE